MLFGADKVGKHGEIAVGAGVKLALKRVAGLCGTPLNTVDVQKPSSTSGSKLSTVTTLPQLLKLYSLLN